ncbi:type II secretion system F family protein [Nevskia sp.]|uniref:type II secretion system F family protein n=1 Tax=Nevskia sp. TaxID=1929292 RepID=UPI0025E31CBD|nr:type II secretion system F family protein [Nevskia sp.]
MAVASTLVKDARFAWEGRDRKGTMVKGVSDGPSEAHIKLQLRKQGINPIRVRKQSALFAKRKKPIKGQDIAVFSRQLATMMSAGVPLVQSLEIVGRGHANPSMGEMVLGIKGTIEGGATLAESLAKYPRHFDDLFVNLVDAGERSGALEALLDKIATYKEKTESLKKKVKKAMTYPAAVIAVAMIVTSILLYFVVPQFASLFQGFGADLPAFTKMVISLSEFIQADWWLILLVGLGAFFGLREAHIRSPKVRRFTDRLLLKLPVVGDILYKSAVARYARTLSTMFAAGVPLVEAMDSVAKAAGNIVFTEAIMQMRDQVSTGQQLQLTMQQTGLFPAMAVQMVAIGEESGSLDHMCAKLADFYEEEVDALVDNLTALLEPMIMVVLGVLVGGLVVAMYLPIFKIGAAI